MCGLSLIWNILVVNITFALLIFNKIWFYISISVHADVEDLSWIFIVELLNWVWNLLINKRHNAIELCFDRFNQEIKHFSLLLTDDDEDNIITERLHAEPEGESGTKRQQWQSGWEMMATRL